MATDHDTFIRTLAIESWTMYAFGMLIIGCRLFSRRLRSGSWRLGIDDWLMIFASANFTGVMVSVNAVAVNGSNYMDPEVAAALTPEEKEHAVYGSIMTFVLEIFTLTCIWTVKACLLILYYRLTSSLRRWQIAVFFIAGYCVIAYSVVMGMFMGYWCTPIPEYWAVPVNISECATYYKHMIFATAWNISSDLMLLAIPFPIVFKTQLPLKRKIGLCFVLGLGVLNILVAILNRYFNFNNPNDLGYVYFYVAEVATAIYVGNIPLCWPLVQLVFRTGPWSRGSASDSQQRKYQGRQPRTRTGGTNPLSRRKGTSATNKTLETDIDMEGEGGCGAGTESAGSSSPYLCPANVNDGQTSTVELTRPWGDSGADIHSEAHAHAADSEGTFWLAEEAQGRGTGGNIVKTVQVSHTVHTR